MYSKYLTVAEVTVFVHDVVWRKRTLTVSKTVGAHVWKEVQNLVKRITRTLRSWQVISALLTTCRNCTICWKNVVVVKVHWMEKYRDCDHGAAWCRQITKAIITFEGVKTEDGESVHDLCPTRWFRDWDSAW